MNRLANVKTVAYVTAMAAGLTIVGWTIGSSSAQAEPHRDPRPGITQDSANRDADNPDSESTPRGNRDNFSIGNFPRGNFPRGNFPRGNPDGGNPNGEGPPRGNPIANEFKGVIFLRNGVPIGSILAGQENVGGVIPLIVQCRPHPGNTTFSDGYTFVHCS